MGYLYDAISRAQQSAKPPAGGPAVGAVPPAEALPPAPPADLRPEDLPALLQPPESLTEAPARAAPAPEPDLDHAIAQTQRGDAPTAASWAGKAAPAEASLELGSAPAPFVPVHTLSDLTATDERLGVLGNPAGVVAEECRAIRTSLLARWQNKRHLVHTLTSAVPQEGKTLTSLNLAAAFAELRTRHTLVIEADLRRPQFTRLLGLEESPGLADLLEGTATVEAALHAVGPRGLHVIPAGRATGNQAIDLLSSPRLGTLLAQWRRRYDDIFIDTPPVLELADAGIIGALSDEVLLAVRLGHTPRGLVDKATRILLTYNAPAAAVIGTDRGVGENGYQGYGYPSSDRPYRGRG